MPKKLTLQQAIENLKSKGHVLLDNEFINTKSNVNYICGLCGEEASQKYYRIMLDISHGCQHKGFSEINKRKRFVTLHRKECKQCGIIFYNKSKKKVFCSKKCLGINFEVNEEYRPILKKEGFLTRDSRIKERKKYGLKKARKKPQFSKR